MFTQRTAKHQTVSANVYAGFYKSDLSTERGSRFKPVANRLSRLVKGRDAVGLGPVFAAMMRILFAVFEQVAVHLLDMVFRQCNFFPRLENQLHGFGVASHFLVISCMEGLDFKAGQQLFDLSVGEFAAFNAGGCSDAFNGGLPCVGQIDVRKPRCLKPAKLL